VQIFSEHSVGYSRQIGTAERGFILSRLDADAGPKPPRITHQGIEDSFLEKASVVLYFHAGKWFTLPGAD
jgi:hypothetical protein